MTECLTVILPLIEFPEKNLANSLSGTYTPRVGRAFGRLTVTTESGTPSGQTPRHHPVSGCRAENVSDAAPPNSSYVELWVGFFCFWAKYSGGGASSWTMLPTADTQRARV